MKHALVYDKILSEYLTEPGKLFQIHEEVLMLPRVKSAYRHIVRAKHSHAAFSFLLPFFIIFQVFIVQTVHPFGDRMILTVDLYHQYAPFLTELRNKILSGESFFYSWNIGLGTNFWALFANYSASPLNVLALFFPAKYISDCIALLVCIRVGLAGLFMSMLLKDVDRGRKDAFLVVFSSFYALSGWALSYFWNIMWMDALVLLPLIVLGMRKMFRDGKPLLYCLSLFVCLWSNFFTGYFVCLFMVIYAPVCFITLFPGFSWSRLWRCIGRFAFFSALAGGLAAILLYPTYIALTHASATGDAFPKDSTLAHSLFDFFSRFFIGTTPNIRDGMANVYSGLPALIFLPLFFICRNIKLKEKISYGIILLFMFFSFSFNKLNFIWHGMHFPNQIPFRQAFIMSFLMVLIAYRVLRNLGSFDKRDYIIPIGAILSYLIIFPKIGDGSEGFRAISITAVFVLVYLIFLRTISLRGRHVRGATIGFVIVMIVELVVAANVTVLGVAMNEGFTGWDFYGKKEKSVQDFVKGKEQDYLYGPFVRAEIYPHYICNQPALYNIKGMSIFSSTARESYVKFMKGFGLHNNTINSTRNFGLNEVTASLFGISYFVDLETQSRMPSVFSDSEYTDGRLRIFENEDALPIGYMVADTIADYMPPDIDNPIYTTNLFMESMGLSPIYEYHELTLENSSHATLSSGTPSAGYRFNVDSSQPKVWVDLVFSGDYADKQLYLYHTGQRGAFVNVYATNDQTAEPAAQYKDATIGQMIDIGRFQDGQLLRSRLEWNDYQGGVFSVFACSVIPEAYQEMIDTLSSQPFQVKAHSSNTISGTITVSKAGVLLMTVPYDEGWSAWANGNEVEILNIGGALCGIRLEEGQYDIQMRYVPDGINIGAVASLSSLLTLILFMYLQYVKNHPRKKSVDSGELNPINNKSISEKAILDTVIEVEDLGELDDADEPLIE